jgi:D-alanine-D-alanine ligase
VSRRRHLRILVLVHPSLVPPDTLEGVSDRERHEGKTEYDIVTTLKELGHEVKVLGIWDELRPIREAVEEWKPHLAVNLLEEFLNLREYVPHVAGYLQILGLPYTGCGPHGLLLARDKGLAKKVLAYHRIRSPHFVVVRRGYRMRKPRHLAYPLIVKSLTEEASVGIAQASVVMDDERLAERVRFIHESVGSDAIVEEFIEGRELYVGVLGNARPMVLPIWELSFENLPPGAAAIATARVKHDPDYQERRGIFQGEAELEPEMAAHIIRTTRRIYRSLDLDGYARIDYRLRADGALYFLEANPNPEVARSEEFASAAEAAGLTYEMLIERILSLGLRRGRG